MTRRAATPPASLPGTTFERMTDAFRRAARAAGGEEVRAFVIGGQRLVLRTAGPAMLPVLSPALAHLVAAPGKPAGLEVFAWDSASTGVELPAPGSSGDEDRHVWQPGAGILTVLDDSRRRAVVWVASAEDVPSNEVAAPLRAFLHLAFFELGAQFVHAAAVGRADGGLLVVGRSGAGKSTTALACLGSPLGVAGDDYVLATDGPEPRVHSLYSSAKLEPHQLKRFPHLSDGVVNAGALAEKPMILLCPRWAGSVSAGFPLRGAVAPRVVGRGPTRARRVGGAALLAALAPSTIFQLPGTGRHTLARIGSLLRHLPSWELELGENVSEIPLALERVLEEARP